MPLSNSIADITKRTQRKVGAYVEPLEVLGCGQVDVGEVSNTGFGKRAQIVFGDGSAIEVYGQLGQPVR